MSTPPLNLQKKKKKKKSKSAHQSTRQKPGMVFLHKSPAPRLNAFILPSFPIEELDAFKRAFELATCAPFATMLELVLQRAPDDWVGQTFEYMRREEDAAGRDEDPFVVLDERASISSSSSSCSGNGGSGNSSAVWYVGSLATEDDVEYGLAESTDVVWYLPVKTECLPLVFVNYDIGNMGIQEGVATLGVRLPVAPGYEIPPGTASDCGGLDMRRERYGKAAYAVAYPGEYEESTGEELRKAWLPMPEKVARLKEGVAEAVGLLNEWCVCSPAQSRAMPDGSLKEFPDGSVTLALKYNPDFDWPAYEWPEGSL